MRALRNLVRAIAEEAPHPHPQHQSPSRRVLVSLLEAASVAYGGLSAIRRALYDAKVLQPSKVPAPVISVGNITWGGCGKTPMAEYVARECAAIGATPTVLSRGYRGGDEAWMLRRRLGDVPGAKVLVGSDRLKLARDFLVGGRGDVGVDDGAGLVRRREFAYETKFAGDVDVDDVELRCTKEQFGGGGGGAEEGVEAAGETSSYLGGVLEGGDDKDEDASSRRRHGGSDASSSSTTSSTTMKDAIILDDGMQHLRLARDLEVVMVNALARWGSGRLVPRGPLRELPALGLRRAHVVALHHHHHLAATTAAAAEEFEREVKSHMSPDALLIHTRMRPTRVERLARYLGHSPRHEWTPPLNRLRGVRVLCPAGVGDASALKATLSDLVAPAVDDEKNGYGLRLRDTGSVTVWNLGDHEEFTEKDLRAVVGRFREMHAASGEVGGAEAKLVLTEKDVARLRAAGAEKMHRALAILGPADPLVLCAELEISDQKQRAAFSAIIARRVLSCSSSSNAHDVPVG